MGDSYTAAPLFPLDDPEPSTTACARARTTRRWSPTSSASSVIDVSCSGASTRASSATQKFTDQDRAAPARRPHRRRRPGHPRHRRQRLHVLLRDDLRLPRRRRPRPEGAPCRDATPTPRAATGCARNLGKIRNNVARVVARDRRARPRRPHPAGRLPADHPAEGTCRARLPLAVGDYAYTLDLNLRLAKAVRQGGVAAGRRVRRPGRGQPGPRHLLRRALGRRHPRRTTAAGLHPYPAEQEAVAELLVARL